MHSKIRTFIMDSDGARFFGEGPLILLHLIEETGSLRQAAIAMNMGYTKALRLMKHAEQVLGFQLTEKKIGGVNGGGSRLTDEGREFIQAYEAFHNACEQECDRLFEEYLGKWRSQK